MACFRDAYCQPGWLCINSVATQCRYGVENAPKKGDSVVHNCGPLHRCFLYMQIQIMNPQILNHASPNRGECSLSCPFRFGSSEVHFASLRKLGPISPRELNMAVLISAQGCHFGKSCKSPQFCQFTDNKLGNGMFLRLNAHFYNNGIY